jgi:hypothetical protein
MPAKTRVPRRALDAITLRFIAPLFRNVKHLMNIEELHDFIFEVAKTLPDKQSKELISLRDSLEDLGPNEWSHRLELFSNDMIQKNIGDWEKLSVLQGEAERVGSIEIKPAYILLFVVVVALVIFNV